MLSKITGKAGLHSLDFVKDAMQRQFERLGKRSCGPIIDRIELEATVSTEDVARMFKRTIGMWICDVLGYWRSTRYQVTILLVGNLDSGNAQYCSEN